jgi:hypothetical protein
MTISDMLADRWFRKRVGRGELFEISLWPCTRMELCHGYCTCGNVHVSCLHPYDYHNKHAGTSCGKLLAFRLVRIISTNAWQLIGLVTVEAWYLCSRVPAIVLMQHHHWGRLRCLLHSHPLKARLGGVR